MKKVLAGVMYCGENEYAKCIEMIETQKDLNIDIYKIENKPNKEAHDDLYSKFNQSRSQYDYFAKVDADMVFCSTTALNEIIQLMITEDYDHIMIDVKDMLSDIMIPGFNVYHSSVEWLGNKDNLIVDYHGTAKKHGRRIDMHLVDHMPDPSFFQSFAYGVHRGKKAVQSRIQKKDLSRAILHWSILSQICEAYKREKSEHRLYAMLGAQLAFTDKQFSHLNEYKNEKLEEIFLKQILPLVQEKGDSVISNWLNPLVISGTWLNGLQSM